MSVHVTGTCGSPPTATEWTNIRSTAARKPSCAVSGDRPEGGSRCAAAEIAMRDIRRGSANIVGPLYHRTDGQLAGRLTMRCAKGAHRGAEITNKPKSPRKRTASGESTYHNTDIVANTWSARRATMRARPAACSVSTCLHPRRASVIVYDESRMESVPPERGRDPRAARI